MYVNPWTLVIYQGVTYIPSIRGQTGSLYRASWSFSQHQFLAPNQLGPPLQLLLDKVGKNEQIFKCCDLSVQNDQSGQGGKE